MAKGNGNLLLQHFSGQLGKQFVVKQYTNKTVLCAYPDTKKKAPTPLKKLNEGHFAEAVMHARQILQDPNLRIQYSKNLAAGQRLCDLVMSECLKRIKAERGPKYFNS